MENVLRAVISVRFHLSHFLGIFHRFAVDVCLSAKTQSLNRRFVIAILQPAILKIILKYAEEKQKKNQLKYRRFYQVFLIKIVNVFIAPRILAVCTRNRSSILVSFRCKHRFFYKKLFKQYIWKRWDQIMYTIHIL